jgi:DNA-binding beta-propeller fold protein YncE
MKIVVLISVFLASLAFAGDDASQLFWPPAPDTARVVFLGEIECENLSPQSGFLGKLARLIGGKSENEKLTYPFDIAVRDGSLYMVFQDVAALVEIDHEDLTFKLHLCKENPLIYPVSLCDGGEAIFITDPEAGAVYRFREGQVELFIDQGLVRPTGIAALPAEKRLYVIDTGDHSLKIFDYEGKPIKTVPEAGDSAVAFHYPTFAAATANEVLVNDGLNYLIRQFDPDGRQTRSFGQEGDGPGCFARPKGLAVDSDGHIYVVDNMFDNVQVFDNEGRLLLVIGSTGREEGQFWSPAGIDIVNDTIYIADMFNSRVQLLHYLGGRP